MDIMLDIETLATSYDAAIVQIGAVVFDRETGTTVGTFKKNITRGSCEELGLRVDEDTVNWWKQQSELAIENVFGGERVDLQTALSEFAAWVQLVYFTIHNDTWFNREKVCVWCHASFDAPLMANAFRVARVPLPWYYRSPRDLRTLIDIGQVDPKQFTRDGIEHDALDDCFFQIRYTIVALEKLKLRNN